jgi:hypothetical protein
MILSQFIFKSYVAFMFFGYDNGQNNLREGAGVVEAAAETLPEG